MAYNYNQFFLLCSELPPTTLAEILAPSSLMLGHKFELSVDEWKFIGHPFSVQGKTFGVAFNVVFIFQVSDIFAKSANTEEVDFTAHLGTQRFCKSHAHHYINSRVKEP
jgi:hypothetical protein